MALVTIERPTLIYRMMINLADYIREEGEQGVERIYDRLREFGYVKEIRRLKKPDADGKLWAVVEWGLPCDDPEFMDGAFPYELSDAKKVKDLKIQSVRLSRKEQW